MFEIATFTDGDGCTWVRNGDGTFRCLDAEIRSMTIQDIEKEFGPLTDVETSGLA